MYQTTMKPTSRDINIQKNFVEENTLSVLFSEEWVFIAELFFEQ